MYATNSLNEFKSWLMLAITALIVLAIIPLLFWGTTFSKTFITFLTPISSFLVVCLLIYTAWWSYKNHEDVFKSWLFLSVGIGLYFIANALYFIFNIVGTISSPSIADVLYFTAYPILTVGIFLFLKRPYKIRYKNLLDVILIMISLFFIVWFYFIWPTVGPSQPDTLSVILSIFFLFLDLLFLMVVLTVLFNVNKKITELPLVLLSFGLFFQIFGDMTSAYNVLNPSLLYGWSISVLYTSNSILAILAITSYLKNIKIDFKYLITRYRISKPDNYLLSFLPLILVLFTYSLLIITTPDEALIWGVGVIVGLVILRQVISLIEIRKAQKVLKSNKELIAKREEQLSFITTNMADLITESDNNGVYKFVSYSSNHILGISPENLLGKSFYDFIHPTDLEEVSKSLKNTEKSRSNARLQYRYKNAQDKYIWIETIAKPIFDHDKFKGFIYSSRDITEQKKAEKFVKESLLEKETLLREIHHRVNNNLQIILSLLSLQSRNIVNEKDHELFRESQNQVRSMAMIHEKLYQSNNLNSINFSNYVKTLLDSLIYDNPHDLSHINVEYDVEDIELNIETSVPCGLIINELVSNSIKHAFPPDTEGNISIKMYHDNDDNYVLMVADDGVGSVRETEMLNDNELGLKLVNSLVKQLGGTIKILEGKETAYKIVFQELEYRDRFEA